jgi:hypothetical protein
VRLRVWLSLVCLLRLGPGALAQAANHGRSASEARCGPLVGQLFRCARFSFTYKAPFGWVDRTEDEEETNQASSEGGRPADKAGAGQSEILLKIYERPPDAPGKTINSAVVIAEESLSRYPGLKTAADYLGPIADIAERNGFQMLDQPYRFAVEQKPLVRGDFSREQGNLKMFESSLVMIAKGSIVSFTFVAESKEEIEDLIAGLSFQGSGHETAPRRSSR